MVQRGIYESGWRDIAWETLRERGAVNTTQLRLVRKPVSWVGRIAHSLGMRRERASDRSLSPRTLH